LKSEQLDIGGLRTDSVSRNRDPLPCHPSSKLRRPGNRSFEFEWRQVRLQRQAERTLELLDQDQARLQDEMTSQQGAFSESLEAMAQVRVLSEGERLWCCEGQPGQAVAGAATASAAQPMIQLAELCAALCKGLQMLNP
jgi:hypothetical protein